VSLIREEPQTAAKHVDAGGRHLELRNAPAAAPGVSASSRPIAC
jgi:hypothetical protein